MVEVDRDAHRIRLRPSPPGKRFPRSCEELVVHARFDLEAWSDAARSSVTRESHERSLKVLLQAQATREIVRVGVVGRGFGALPEKPKCEVASAALQFAVDRDGVAGILSFFEEPGRVQRGGS